MKQKKSRDLLNWKTLKSLKKVRIYHYELHKRAINKSTILKLKTPEKEAKGHQECANFLADEIRNLWEKEAKLNEKAQEDLLKEVATTFTEEDNNLLDAPITNQEIKDSLNSCNMKAAPGTDSITYQTYKTCWHILGEDLGDVLREVVQSKKPTESMKHSFMFFTPKSGKSSPPRPKDLRKISLLNSDFKILSGVYANRLKKMEEHTLSNIQYSVKPRKVTHAICEARDAINSIKPGQKGVAIGEFDFMQAFDLLCLEGWTWRVFEAKGASPTFIATMKALYTDPEGAGYCIPVINNEKMPRVKNIRKILRQGDRVSCTLYNYSVDPLLTYLERRLQGITYHKLKTHGPKHPKLGGPAPLESRFKLAGYIDDIKTSISNREEFHTLDNALHLFEEASGCRLHRDPKSGKCNLLTLGQWTGWKQEDIPLNYMKLTDNLNFLGVQLAKNASTTRSINGEVLTERVKSKIASFKAGRFSPLVCRPYAANTYIMSKICYRAAVFDLRCKDLKSIQSSVKSWISQDLLMKPKETILHRAAEDGGMGLLHPPSRCQAILTKTFVDQAHPRSPCDNLMLKSLYRSYITGDLDKSTIKRPSYYPETMFALIKSAHETNQGDILNLPTKLWQNMILEKGVTHTTDEVHGEPTLIPTPQEEQMQDVDWQRSRDLRNIRGLPPSNRSLILKWSENLCINQERLFKLGKCESDNCEFCAEEEVVDRRQHLWFCKHNSHINQAMVNMIEHTTGKKPTPNQLCVFDFDLPSSHSLPIMYVLSSTLELLLEARHHKKILNIGYTKTIILTKSKMYSSTKKLQNTFEIIRDLLSQFMNG